MKFQSRQCLYCLLHRQALHATRRGGTTYLQSWRSFATRYLWRHTAQILPQKMIFLTNKRALQPVIDLVHGKLSDRKTDATQYYRQVYLTCSKQATDLIEKLKTDWSKKMAFEMPQLVALLKEQETFKQTYMELGMIRTYLHGKQLQFEGPDSLTTPFLNKRPMYLFPQKEYVRFKYLGRGDYGKRLPSGEEILPNPADNLPWKAIAEKSDVLVKYSDLLPDDTLELKPGSFFGWQKNVSSFCTWKELHQNLERSLRLVLDNPEKAKKRVFTLYEECTHKNLEQVIAKIHIGIDSAKTEQKDILKNMTFVLALAQVLYGLAIDVGYGFEDAAMYEDKDEYTGLLCQPYDDMSLAKKTMRAQSAESTLVALRVIDTAIPAPDAHHGQL